MSSLTPLSQRDPRWANEILGTKGTIGNLGCTITCIAMLCKKTPFEVNEALKRVAGYAQGNLVVWSKLNQAIPGLTFEKRIYSYNNDDVKANLPCLVEVDGSRIGAPKHWVLYIGNGQMIDPWTGVVKSTSYYPAIGYAVLKYITPAVSPSVELRDQDKYNFGMVNLGNGQEHVFGVLELQAARSIMHDQQREVIRLKDTSSKLEKLTNSIRGLFGV